MDRKVVHGFNRCNADEQLNQKQSYSTEDELLMVVLLRIKSIMHNHCNSIARHRPLITSADDPAAEVLNRLYTKLYEPI
jgi:hypothetical protein